VVLGSFLACGFVVKAGTKSEYLWAIVIGAANGTAVGFAFGPAEKKGAAVLSGLFAGTPFYFFAGSILAIADGPSEVFTSALFVTIGIASSFVQAFRVRRRVRQNLRSIPLAT